jgi:hypothetical protein
VGAPGIERVEGRDSAVPEGVRAEACKGPRCTPEDRHFAEIAACSDRNEVG